MLPFAIYLLKVTICSGILFGYYWLLLRNKIFHQYNRFYLLSIVLLSLSLPFIEIYIWHSADATAPQAIQLLQVVGSSNEYLDEIIVTSKPTNISTEQGLTILYLLITLVFFGAFIQTIFRIRTLFKKHRHSLVENVYFVNTTAKGTPFSFLRYIFWNDHIDPESPTGHQIFKHELAHVQQKHSYDKLFINATLIVCWCNPFFWFIRKELNMIHEFVADKIAVEDSDTETFAAMILQATYPQHRFHLTNPFFYSPIKRRLLMLTKNENPKVSYVGRILVLPLAVLVFAAFTLKAKPFKSNNNPVYNGKKITVVIDAGHGGTDAGARSIDGSITEKELTLAIIKKIKALNSNANINLVFTRETDIFQTVQEKADFTKAQNADLFVSIHIASTTPEAANSKTGMLVYVAKDNFVNSVGSKLFASAVIKEFKNDFPLFVSDLPQQREVGIMVLQESSCPAVLIEAGYITNKNDLAYLNTDAGREKIAANILAAIEKFANVNQINAAHTENILDSKLVSTGGIYINSKHTDTNYLKTDLFKTKALIIVDSKEIGNLGMDYIEKNIALYSSLVTYSPAEAKKRYGNKGRYGVLELTLKDAIFITSDTIFADDKNNSLKISGNKTVINGDLSNSLIYIDGKISTPAEMNAIPPEKISSVNILKGEKLDDIIDASGKTALISIQLKPNNLPEVVVQSKKPLPLYVVDGEIKALGYNLASISADNIQSVNVIKGESALKKYGEAGINGVIEITKKNVPKRILEQTPKLTLSGIPGPRIHVNQLKNIKELNCDNPDYSVVSATIYFSGGGFPQVIKVDLSGESLKGADEYFKKIAPGSAVTFDNVIIEKKNGGSRLILGQGFVFYDKKEDITIIEKQDVTQNTTPAGVLSNSSAAYAQKLFPAKPLKITTLVKPKYTFFK